MPTKHRRHIVTETGPVAEAFARARRVQPDVHVRDLVIAGADAIVERGRQAEVDEEVRAAAIERLIELTTKPGGIDHEAGRYVHDVLGVPELRRDE